MDTRVALKNKTSLKFYNANHGICVYTVEKELSRGGSCIVYEAFYTNNTGTKKLVRMKECYPFSLNIKREIDGFLTPVKNEEEKFQQQKEKMRVAFDWGNKLFYTSGLTNFTSNTIDLYECNNTIYIVTTYQEGETLSQHEFSSFQDCISVVKSTAKVIDKVHNYGYLYLDLKPENIFVLTGTYDIVQLFDFDSLIPMVSIEQECRYKISYTKGFSALELKMGNQKKIGKHTDVYGIGAVLFYLIFGIIPEAPDCELDAEYEYTSSKYEKETFQDGVYQELTEFFHNTLANYYLDRYQDMQQVIVKLEEIEKLADISTPYIQSSHIVSPQMLVGRKQELDQLIKWMEQPNNPILFVTGMGGMGKSSLVRGFLAEQSDKFDRILCLNYHHSIKETIVDDGQFVIHTILKNESEEVEEYFFRKLSIARKITRGKKILLVIDNYEGDDFDGMEELLKLGWKMIIITRGSILAKDSTCICVEAIKQKADLYMMFESYMRHPIEEKEFPVIDRIIEKVQGHTLVLELIAKQIKYSFLSVFEAEALLCEHGFSKIAPEKVPYTKDHVCTLDTIKNIIDQLFLSTNMTEQKKAMVKVIAFFGINGISVNLFVQLCELETKDFIWELLSQGWVHVEKHTLKMHPVIMETVLHWKMTENFLQVANGVMIELRKRIPEDRALFLSLGEEFLACCDDHSILTFQQSYRELLFSVLSNMQRHREDSILSYAIKLTQNLGTLNGNDVIKLYDLIGEIYEERREFEKAYQTLIQGKAIVDQFADDFIKGQYYYLWVGYFDQKLDGYYMTTNKEEEKLLSSLKKSLEKAIQYMKKSKHPENQKLLAEYLRCKANILIRSNPRRKRKISALLKTVELILKQENLENSEIASAYYLTQAWYYTYVEMDDTKLFEYISLSYHVGIQRYENDLDKIDCLFVPIGNLLSENGKEEEAADWLYLGIELCNEKENQEMIPFVRKKLELYTYLLEVYGLTGNEKKYGEIMEMIEKEKEQYKEFENFLWDGD